MISRKVWKIDLDTVESVVGLWLFFSPWVLMPAASMSNILIVAVLGLLVAADGLWAVAKPDLRSPEWVMVLLGIGVGVSPWLMGTMGETAMVWNAWIVGAALVVLAGLTFALNTGRKSGRSIMAH